MLCSIGGKNGVKLYYSVFKVEIRSYLVPRYIWVYRRNLQESNHCWFRQVFKYCRNSIYFNIAKIGNIKILASIGNSLKLVENGNIGNIAENGNQLPKTAIFGFMLLIKNNRKKGKYMHWINRRSWARHGIHTGLWHTCTGINDLLLRKLLENRHWQVWQDFLKNGEIVPP